MEIKYKPSFLKDFNKIKQKEQKEKIFKICFEQIRNIKRILDIKNCKKIKGYENYYRIRIGEYRIGFGYKSNKIVFMRVLKRNEIYRYFP